MCGNAQHNDYSYDRCQKLAIKRKNFHYYGNMCQFDSDFADNVKFASSWKIWSGARISNLPTIQVIVYYGNSSLLEVNLNDAIKLADPKNHHSKQCGQYLHLHISQVYVKC